ncbi:hypothetical protein [Sphingomonas sp. LT1P40]|uniref:hypothetical protein n=1 Tax=Alteristakelama amylovorans TaxID=3096166 RepID=UPI002FC9BEF7
MIWWSFMAAVQKVTDSLPAKFTPRQFHIAVLAWASLNNGTPTPAFDYNDESQRYGAIEIAHSVNELVEDNREYHTGVNAVITNHGTSDMCMRVRSLAEYRSNGTVMYSKGNRRGYTESFIVPAGRSVAVHGSSYATSAELKADFRLVAYGWYPSEPNPASSEKLRCKDHPTGMIAWMQMPIDKISSWLPG